MNTIKLSGKKVSVTETERGFLFGKEDAADVVVLRFFGEINGFLNAVGDVKDSAYENLQHGFHMHKERAAAWNAAEALYVRWIDTGVGSSARDFLGELEIIPQQKQAWFVLNKRSGIWLPGYPVKAFTTGNGKLAEVAAQAAREELVEKGLQDADDPTMPVLSTDEMTNWVLNNNKAWNQVNLHNGVELVLHILDGSKAVEIRPSPEDTEARLSVVTTKVRNLVSGKDEERREARAEATTNGIAYEQTKKGASVIARNPEVKAKAEAAVVGGVTVIIGGATHTKQVSDLVGATVRRVKDGLASGIVFMKDENMVLRTFQMAEFAKQSVEVVRLPA